MTVIAPPDRATVAPYYHGYLDHTHGSDAVALLEENRERTWGLLDAVPPEAETFRYGPGKWSIREVVGHLADTERVFAHRAVHFARRDPAPLPGMDPDGWARASGAHHRSLADLREELRAVRGASLALFRSLPPEVLDLTGTASGFTFPVRALPWIVAGHELHHLRVLRERYLPALPG